MPLFHLNKVVVPLIIDLNEIRERLEEMRGNKADKGTEEPSEEEILKALRGVRNLPEVVKRTVKLKLAGKAIVLSDEVIDGFKTSGEILCKSKKPSVRLAGVYIKMICSHLTKVKQLEKKIDGDNETIQVEIEESLLWMTKHAGMLLNLLRQIKLHELNGEEW